MTNNPDYRRYLEERFAGMEKIIAERLDNMHDTLIDIKAQTTKTNGRVSDIEDDITKLDKDFATHPINCSSAKEVREIKQDLEEYRVMKKYPKVALLVIAFFVLTTIISIYQAVKASNQLVQAEMNIRRSIDYMEGVSKVTRGGYVKYNDEGLSDSVKIK